MSYILNVFLCQVTSIKTNKGLLVSGKRIPGPDRLLQLYNCLCILLAVSRTLCKSVQGYTIVVCGIKIGCYKVIACIICLREYRTASFGNIIIKLINKLLIITFGSVIIISKAKGICHCK